MSASDISSAVGVVIVMLAMIALMEGEDTQLGGPKVSEYPDSTLLDVACKGSGPALGGSLEIGESDLLEKASAVTWSFPGIYMGVKL